MQPLPAQRFAPELLLKAQGQGPGMRAAIFDVDGVLTDGRLYISEQGESLKAFHVLDGHGLKMLALAGIEPVVITGRDSPAVRRRMSDLGVRETHFGVADKLAVAQLLLSQRGWTWPEVAAIGDDWPDLPLLGRAGLSCAPPGAHVEVRALVHHITQAGGGAGAAREFCDLLLMASGHYRRLLDEQRQTLDAR